MTELIYKQYSGFVKSLAKRYYIRNPKYSFSDLVSEGNLAIANSIRSFKGKIEKGPHFGTYVYFAIRNRILNFTQENYYDLHVPRGHQKKCYDTGTSEGLKRKFVALRITKILKKRLRSL